MELLLGQNSKHLWCSFRGIRKFHRSPSTMSNITTSPVMQKTCWAWILSKKPRRTDDCNHHYHHDDGTICDCNQIVHCIVSSHRILDLSWGVVVSFFTFPFHLLFNFIQKLNQNHIVYFRVVLIRCFWTERELFLRMANGIHAPNYFNVYMMIIMIRSWWCCRATDMIVIDILQNKDGWVFVKP